MKDSTLEHGGAPLVDTETSDDAERPTKPAMLRGWRRRCPNCGNGPMMSGYLKVRDNCPVCEEELHHHRADDGPAYLTILIVGHILAPLILFVYTAFRPDPLIMAVGFSIGCVALSLYLLPRLKGLMVGLQWAKRMHGFGSEPG
ncbi:DUF983 domain-containing protein [Vannielia sp.]|uniref:DUF983 domain-containing protein n=1 Tax=Vannielia sp. TaxID=2813045 RepID=UPI00260CBBF0|nr:DUF983 domain-containing protein [Vannielia sp.]MDF1874031.1 DUF983 domain-containing protein [Vannielia sp.]